MKTQIEIKSLIIICSTILIASGCKSSDPIPLAEVTTTSISDISFTTAKSGGTVVNDGGESVTARGVCWSTNASPTINDNKTSDGAGAGSFTSSITSLTPNTSYFARAYATNGNGTAYGISFSFTTTAATKPELTTSSVGIVSGSSVISGGNITSDGGVTITSRGVCWSTSPNPTVSDSKTTDGTGTGNFTSNVAGLSLGTKYYIRAYAINNIATAYGNEINFTTPTLPNVSTASVLSVTLVTAKCGGTIISDGGVGILDKGIVWNTSPNPTILNNKIGASTGITEYVINLNSLSPGIKYYVRAYANNIVGTSYGNEISFTTSNYSTGPTDADGNTYTSINIGNQIWMVENLKTTKYTNGDIILNVPNSSLYDPHDGAWAYYNNDIQNNSSYGKLYNWYTVSDSRKLCPTGWHIPSNSEWTAVIDYLGGPSNAVNLLKGSGVAHWPSPNSSATNSSGFTGLPSGYRTSNGIFTGIGTRGDWWSSTEYGVNGPEVAYSYNMNQSIEQLYFNKIASLSVRCIKD